MYLQKELRNVRVERGEGVRVGEMQGDRVSGAEGGSERGRSLGVWRKVFMLSPCSRCTRRLQRQRTIKRLETDKDKSSNATRVELNTDVFLNWKERKEIEWRLRMNLAKAEEKPKCAGGE